VSAHSDALEQPSQQRRTDARSIGVAEVEVQIRRDEPPPGASARDDSSIEIAEEAEALPPAPPPPQQQHLRSKPGTPSKSPYSFVTMSSDEKKRPADDSPASLFSFETEDPLARSSSRPAQADNKGPARSGRPSHVDTRRNMTEAPSKAAEAHDCEISKDRNVSSMQEMYDAAVRARERKLRRYEDERRRREAVLRDECPFAPQISAAAREIRRSRSAVPHCYSDGRPFKLWLMQQKRPEDQQLTFEPEINAKSRLLINRWRSSSSRPVLPADQRLYEDGKRRLANMEANATGAHAIPGGSAPRRTAAEMMALVEHLQSHAARKDVLLERLREREAAKHRPPARRVDPAAVVERLVCPPVVSNLSLAPNEDLTFEPRVSFVSQTIAERHKAEQLRVWFDYLTDGEPALEVPLEPRTGQRCRVAADIGLALSAAKLTEKMVSFPTFMAALVKHEQKFGPQLWSHTEPAAGPRQRPKHTFVPQISDESKRLCATSHAYSDSHVFARLFQHRPRSAVSANGPPILPKKSAVDVQPCAKAKGHENAQFALPTTVAMPAAHIPPEDVVVSDDASLVSLPATSRDPDDILHQLQRAIIERENARVTSDEALHEPKQALVPIPVSSLHNLTNADAKKKAAPPMKQKHLAATLQNDQLPSGRVDLLLEFAKARARGGAPDKEKNARLRQLGRSLINQQLH
jgi:hypothetical protein